MTDRLESGFVHFLSIARSRRAPDVPCRAGSTHISATGCGLLQSGPSDKEVTAVVETTPPSPPTVGPTVLSDVTSVNVEERGRYKR